MFLYTFTHFKHSTPSILYVFYHMTVDILYLKHSCKFHLLCSYNSAWRWLTALAETCSLLCSFWAHTLCPLSVRNSRVIYLFRCFKGTHCHHLHQLILSTSTSFVHVPSPLSFPQLWLVNILKTFLYTWHISSSPTLLHPHEPNSVTLKMVTTHSSETSKLTHYSVHCKNPKDHNLRFNGINKTVQ
jgi:hypothetical protein